MSDARIVVLGGGFGGLELTSRLSEQFGDRLEIELIDQSDAFVFGFSKRRLYPPRACRYVPPGLAPPRVDRPKPGAVAESR